jgi:ABC-2 type transport system ATP-binding protein
MGARYAPYFPAVHGFLDAPNLSSILGSLGRWRAVIMIETQGLTKFYADQPVLWDVTFQAEKGEILGFLGPNGAGKTTTMRILTCYLAPTRGTARVAGFDILESPLEVRRRMGYLPENVPLYEDMRVHGYLEFVAEVKNLAGDARRKQVGEALESCGLSQVQIRIIGNLSKGYRQRVGLAQALLGNPEVLILDEPTVGLDPQQIIEIRNLIKNLGGARIQVTVAVEGAQKASALLAAMPGVKRVEAQPPVEEGTLRFLVESDSESDLRAPIAQAAVQNGISLLGLRGQDLSLEEIFIQTISKEEVAAHA